MKFLVDAQLPYRLRSWLQSGGHDAIHTLDLPAKNLSTDQDITILADPENRIVITKDSDFLKLHVLRNRPARLLLVTTGNIVNEELIRLFEHNLDSLSQLFEKYDVVELNNLLLIGHSPSPHDSEESPQ